MCGISLCINKNDSNNSIHNVLNALYQLQNRGYDSFGISYYDSNEKNYKIIKKAQGSGCTQTNDLYKDFVKMSQGHDSSICVGHSRWATHGMITDANAHPHISNHNKFICVHNGIIENFQILKSFLVKQGYVFYSQTDTEIIVNLIEYHYENMNKNKPEEDYTECIMKSIRLAIDQLSGTYGLVILNNIIPDVIHVIKNGSPLLIAENHNAIYASSELCGFDKTVQNYIEVENNSLLALSQKSGIKFLSGHTKSPSHKKINPELFETYMTQQLGIYNHYTQKEILEQGNTLMMSLNNGARMNNGHINLGGLSMIRDQLATIKHIVFLGCGSSYYAGQIGSHYIRDVVHNNSDLFQEMNVWCFDAGDFEEKHIPRGQTCLFVFISQSGETMDLIKHLPLLKSKNHLTMGIINVIDSTIAREVHCGVYMNVGREVAVASTKSFTSSLIIMKLFSLWLLQEKNALRHSLPENKVKMIKTQDHIKMSISDIYKLIYQVKYINENSEYILCDFNIDSLNSDQVFVLGRDKYQYIAQECALKMKEICYIHAEGFSANSLKHGPLALIHNGFPVVLLLDMFNYEKMMNNYKEIHSRGAFVVILTSLNNESVNYLREQKNTKVIQIPQNSYIDEILYIVMIQHLCYNLSCHRNINPDKPKNLAKVVTVE